MRVPYRVPPTLYYFESVKTSKSSKQYRDVGAAFEQELGIEE